VRAHEGGDHDSAKARCAWLLERQPEFAPALSMLGAIAQAEGRDDDALAWFGRAVAAAPDSDDGKRARRFLDAEQRRPPGDPK